VENSKIKNYIIILLALVNIFLLYIVLNSASEERQASNYRRQALETVLKSNGITLNPKITLPDKVPSQISLKRDLSSEHSKVGELLGNCEAQDQGGNIYYYSSENGDAQFRGTGDFEINLKSGILASGKDPAAAAKTALNKLEIAFSGNAPALHSSGSDSKVTVNCSWNDTPVYNAAITLNFEDGWLIKIAGKRLLDSENPIASSGSFLDGVSVLMKFLESIHQTGAVCSEINDLRLGYFLSTSVSGDCTLNPVWCILTDSQPYYIDALSGKALSTDSAAVS